MYILNIAKTKKKRCKSLKSETLFLKNVINKLVFLTRTVVI